MQCIAEHPSKVLPQSSWWANLPQRCPRNPHFLLQKYVPKQHKKLHHKKLLYFCNLSDTHHSGWIFHQDVPGIHIVHCGALFQSFASFITVDKPSSFLHDVHILGCSISNLSKNLNINKWKKWKWKSFKILFNQSDLYTTPMGSFSSSLIEVLYVICEWPK